MPMPPGPRPLSARARRRCAAFLQALRRTGALELAAAADVRLSAQAVGLTPGAIHQRRRARPRFAEATRAALARGYDDVEFTLLDPDGTDLGDLDPGAAPHPLHAMTVGQALRLRTPHRRTQRLGAAHRNHPGPGRPAEPSVEELRAKVAREVRKVKRRRARDGAANAARHARRAGRRASGPSDVAGPAPATPPPAGPDPLEPGSRIRPLRRAGVQGADGAAPPRRPADALRSARASWSTE